MRPPKKEGWGGFAKPDTASRTKQTNKEINETDETVRTDETDTARVWINAFRFVMV
jgi:hypothetical protein